jgi:hypothetical protein
MTLIVEDGTGIDDAESYASLAQAADYHSKFNNTEWADSDDTTREAGLRRATQFLDTNYRARFVGFKADPTQTLEWPRVYNLYQYPGQSLTPVEWNPPLPQCVVTACMELALRYVKSGDLQPDLDRGGAVASKTVGAISISYFAGAPGGKQFRQIDAILGKVIGGGGSSNIKLRRG